MVEMGYPEDLEVFSNYLKEATLRSIRQGDLRLFDLAGDFVSPRDQSLFLETPKAHLVYLLNEACKSFKKMNIFSQEGKKDRPYVPFESKEKAKLEKSSLQEESYGWFNLILHSHPELRPYVFEEMNISNPKELEFDCFEAVPKNSPVAVFKSLTPGEGLYKGDEHRVTLDLKILYKSVSTYFRDLFELDKESDSDLVGRINAVDAVFLARVMENLEPKVQACIDAPKIARRLLDYEGSIRRGLEDYVSKADF